MSRLGVIAVACAVLLAGCTGADAGASHSPNPAAASGRVTVPDAVVEFPRTLQAARMVEALVTTNGDAGALVTSARLDSPLFADSPARDGEHALYVRRLDRDRDGLRYEQVGSSPSLGLGRP